LNTPKVAPALIKETYDNLQSIRKTGEELGISHKTVCKYINKPDNIPANHDLIGVSTLIDEKSGEPKLTWYKSKGSQEKAIDLLIGHLNEIKYTPAPKIDAPKKTKQELLSLYTLTDFHLGMYAWADETGEDWDTEIASRVLMNAIHDMIGKAPDSETGVLNLQGDFLHWDGLEALTPTAGNLLEADTRFARMVEIAMDLSSWVIDALIKKHKKVQVIVCEGNHDLAGAAWLRKHLKKLWVKNPRVTVDDTEFPYYAYLHGRIMLAFHHGHKKTIKNLPSLFASEPRYRGMWGKAKYCYIHTGHYHKSELVGDEFGGAIVERHPTLAARDAYAARGGFISQRGAKVITYDKELGEIDRSTVLPR